jgi:iron complex outermembrane recepter protein
MLLSNIKKTAHTLMARAITPAMMTVFATLPIPGLSQSKVAGTLEEVVVTARKRTESLQEVPIAITAMSGEELSFSGVSNLADIQSQVPALTVYAARGTSSTITAYIRGVGQSDPLWGVEPGVGLYIDDVYIARPQGALLEVFDVERVEVLRGPQGTLYGRNSIGGAIKYISSPISENSELNLKMTLGSYGRKDIKASHSSALIENKLYMRTAVASLYRDGFGENLFTGDELSDKQLLTGRTALQFRASDTLSVNFAADITKDTSSARSGQRMTTNQDESLLLAMASGTLTDLSGLSPLLSGIYRASDVIAAANDFPALPASDSRYDVNNGIENQKADNNSSGASITIDYTINDSWSLKSVSAYREGDSDGGIDFDMGPLPIADIDGSYFDHQSTQEFLFNYDSGDRWQAVMGVYYIDATAGGEINNRFLLPVTIQANAPPLSLPFDVMTPVAIYKKQGGEIQTRSYSFYGEANWGITDRLSLTIGGRYTWEKKDAKILAQDFSDDSFDTVVGTDTDFTGDESWSNFSPKLGVDFQLSSDVLLYTSVSQGFKSGGFNIRARASQVPESVRPYDEETVTAYELGIKSEIADRITLNTAYFYSDYKDIQLSIFSKASDGTFFGDFTNAGQGVIQGVEFEGNVVLTPGFQLNSNLTYLDAQYKEFIDKGVDVADQQSFTNTPEWTGSVSLTYQHQFMSGAEIVARTIYSYRDDVIPTTDLSDIIAQSSYDTVDLSVTYFSADNQWRVTLEGKNLTDEGYRTTGYDFRPSGFNFVQGFYGDPRTAALHVQYSL